MDNKVAIITRATGSIGGVVSKLFAEHGAQVIMTDVLDENGHRIALKIGMNTYYRHYDVIKKEHVASIVDFAVEKFGKLDIMFNNVGVGTPIQPVEMFDLNNYDRHNTIIIRGVIVGIKHVAQVMIPVQQGVILKTASTAAMITNTSFPLGYNICKSSLPRLTKIAAYHLGKHGIRVNTISPHAIPNPLVVDWLNMLGGNSTFEIAEQAFFEASSLLGKRIIEEDVAKGSLFFCSDDSRYVSGKNLVVDGGWCNNKERSLMTRKAFIDNEACQTLLKCLLNSRLCGTVWSLPQLANRRLKTMFRHIKPKKKITEEEQIEIETISSCKEKLQTRRNQNT